VVVAVASAPVGIDVERIRKPRLDVALRFFSEEEKGVLLKLPDEEQTQYFYRLWTIKESYLKLTGEGLTASLNTFTVKQQDENFAIFKEEVKQNIHVKIYPGIPGFCLAVSSEENSFAELVNTDISSLAG
jgi:4'-phosphopantetheinyl transferase